MLFSTSEYARAIRAAIFQDDNARFHRAQIGSGSRRHHFHTWSPGRVFGMCWRRRSDSTIINARSWGGGVNATPDGNNEEKLACVACLFFLGGDFFSFLPRQCITPGIFPGKRFGPRLTRRRMTGIRVRVSESAEGPCLLITYRPLCLNCSTCVIRPNLANSNGRSLNAVFRHIMPGAGEKNKSAYQHFVCTLPPMQ